MSVTGTKPASAAACRRSSTLVQRLTRVLVFWVAVIWMVCIAGVVVFVHYQINNNFDHELEESAQRMLDIVTHNLDIAGRPAAGAPPLVASPPLTGSEELVYRLVDLQGRPLLVSEPALHGGFFGGAPLQQGFYNRDGWRIFTAVHPERPLLLQLADPRPERRRAVRRVLLGLAFPMLAVLAVLPFLLGAVARRELRVLRRLEAEIALRGGDDLRPLPLAGMPRELVSVGDRVNLLLERLKQALDVERALASNAAHELRTPLAAVRLRLQTALDAQGGVSPDDVQAAMTALDVLRHRTEKLLQLSRAESAAGLVRVPVDLVKLAATVAQEFWITPALQERLVLRIPEVSLPDAQGDVDGLAIALRNLVENALRYSKGRVEIALQSPCVLVVRDYGAGVPPERLQALRSRHVRDTDSRAGYGLGLSIVSSIVERHRGGLELVSPLPDGASGLEVRIHLLPVAVLPGGDD